MHSQWVVLLVALCAISTCYTRHMKNNNHHSHHNHHGIHCFSNKELRNSPSEVVDHFVRSRMSWERYSAVNLVQQLEKNENKNKRRKRTPVSTCPKLETLIEGEGTHQRSISPWKYTIDIDENRYPQKLAFAQCLCNHCISSETGKETASLNSVMVTQTMQVLRRKTCPHNSALSTFELEYISVPVACTCTVPRE